MDHQKDVMAVLKEKLTGLVNDYFNAEEAVSLFNFLGDEADEINALKFGKLFGSIQDFLIKCACLHTCNMYENKKKYDIISMPAILDFVDENIDKIILEHPDSLDGGVKEFINRNRQILAEDYISISLNAVKNRRDKTIAHREHVSPDVGVITINDLIVLIDNALSFIEEISFPFFGVVYIDDNLYSSLKNDAQLTTRSLKRMLRSLSKK